MRLEPLKPPSRLRAALLTMTAPPLFTFNALKRRKGAFVPCDNSNVFVAPTGAPMVRLLIVIVLGNWLAVVTSLMTVLVPALVMETNECPIYGGTFNDQLVPDSHLPLTLFVQ